jgi:tetratricopeptide (TPR) repeat protein
MSRLWMLLLPIQLFMALSLSAQPDVPPQSGTATLRVLQGHFEETAHQMKPLLESGQLTERERGRGWTLLGWVYQNQGQFQQAMSAYENAIRILGDRSENASDFALALTDFGTLYRDMRQFDAAAQMEMHALQVEQKIGNHGDLALIYVNLADLEVGLKHIKKAQSWLEESVRESKLASNLDESFYAYVASSEASLAELKGNTPSAIAGYQLEIERLTHSLGEQNFTLGWAYMLLGKAYLENGDVRAALGNMRKGCSILLQTVGGDNPRYFVAQIAYAQALDFAGMHAEAIQTRTDAEQKLTILYKEQCVQCRITALGLH